MIKYLKMRFFVLQIKLALFDMFEHGEDVIKFATNLAVSCKDMSGDELRKEFFDALTERIHESNETNENEDK